MSAFDINLNVIGTQLGVPDEEQIKQGANTVEVTLMLGLTLPFSQGQGAPPLQAPLGTVTYNLDRDTAIELFTKGKEAAEKLPQRPKLDIATDMNAVEAAASRLNQFKGSGDGGE